MFLWVKLAIQVLYETYLRTPSMETPALMEKRLQELPADLLEFYEVIITRISEADRYYTYALLELLIRHNGPPMSVLDVRDAVLISTCANYAGVEVMMASEGLCGIRGNRPGSRASSLSTTDLDFTRQARIQIARWGGGLVETNQRGGDDYPQLMHQTVLEFVMGLDFKKVVFGTWGILSTKTGTPFIRSIGV